MTQEAWAPPQVPAETQKEGARWRFHRPPSEDVAAWFNTVPLDDGMEHADYLGGVVLIPQAEKVKYTRPDGGTLERHEQVFTPYMQIGTRVAYSRRLAEHRGLVRELVPAQVPRSENPTSIYFNGNMPDGLWWHCVVGAEGETLRYLCATWRVAFYEPSSYGQKVAGRPSMPVFQGEGTKQVGGGPDPNGIAKAQTGAIGRALGVAGILVIGTGIATAEDMMELPGYGATAVSPDSATLPPTEIAPGEQPVPQSVAEELDALRAQAMALQTQMKERAPDEWRAVAAWWEEYKTEGGWASLGDLPVEALKPLVSRMERDLQAADAKRTTANETTGGAA